MSDQETPHSDAPQEEAPNPTPPPSTSETSDSTNRTVMIVLSYLWILALIPLLVDKDDKEVQWHAKNGLVLTVAEFVLWFLASAITSTGIGCFFVLFLPVIFFGFLVVRVVAIAKGIKGERFMVPWLSDFADKF